MIRRRSKHEKHELFRKDLISAMKLPDSESLQPDDYIEIIDTWKLEWERGVQVPNNPHSITPLSTMVVPEKANNENEFILPKSYFLKSQDEAYIHSIQDLYSIQRDTEEMCRYDLDELDIAWLAKLNELREDTGEGDVSELLMERLIEAFEVESHTNMQLAIRNIEGLGIEYDENVVCDVCRSPDGEESNEMVFCDKCDICVHQACYGIQNIPDGNWLCRTCALGIRPRCILCPATGGAMKSTKNGEKWAHISCALWVPEVSIECPEKMEPITNISQIPGSRWALICSLCKERTGACIQCCVKSCKTSFHVTCAFKNNLKLMTIFDEDSDDVQLKAYCSKHSGLEGEEGEGVDGNGVSPLTEAEKCEIRNQKLKKLAADFFEHVKPSEISIMLNIDDTTTNIIFNYWIIKRKCHFNKPLMTMKMEEGEMLSKQREDSLIARMKMFIHLRQDLERVRNLCYMVNKREKTRQQLYRMKETIFDCQSNIIADVDDTDIAEMDNQFESILFRGHRLTNSVYDDPVHILEAAKSQQMNIINRPCIDSNGPARSSNARTINGEVKERNLFACISDAMKRISEELCNRKNNKSNIEQFLEVEKIPSIEPHDHPNNESSPSQKKIKLDEMVEPQQISHSFELSSLSHMPTFADVLSTNQLNANQNFNRISNLNSFEPSANSRTSILNVSTPLSSSMTINNSVNSVDSINNISLKHNSLNNSLSNNGSLVQQLFDSKSSDSSSDDDDFGGLCIDSPVVTIKKQTGIVNLAATQHMQRIKVLREMPLKSFIVSDEMKRRVEEFFNNKKFTLPFNGMCRLNGRCVPSNKRIDELFDKNKIDQTEALS